MLLNDKNTIKQGFNYLSSDPIMNFFIKNFGEGAIYFGWLGTLIGLIPANRATSIKPIDALREE